MTVTKPLISFENVKRDDIPHYYDYAVAIDRTKKALFEKTGQLFDLYESDEDLEELHSSVQYMLTDRGNEIEIIASVYDHIATKSIHYSKETEYVIKPADTNNVFYLPRFNVAFVSIHIFQGHMDYPREYIFAQRDEDVIAFLKEMAKIDREDMLDDITVLMDGEDGLEREKETITEQIHRDDVLLEADLKRDIFRSIDEFFTEEGSFFKKYQIPYKRGILLYGNPGNGKTTLVKSIAGSVKAPVVYWQITEFTSSYSIDEVFKTVEKVAPVILIIEDIDSLPMDSRSVFLNALDGATSKDGIFLIGTTNYPEKIDPALINRAGRFDRAYEVKQPNKALRKKYLLKKNITQFVPENSIESIAKKTNGLSIAQLNELYMSMALEWHYDNQVDVDKIMEELKENHRRTTKNEWEMEDFEEPLGF